MACCAEAYRLLDGDDPKISKLILMCVYIYFVPCHHECIEFIDLI